MIQFTKLRLNGFKSFVDRTEVEIGPGLTGIVGPNGCGKSNLVEALRWVMGENSAKRMRGDGMEDVIFNGTTQRSKRNIAEVSLLLSNTSRTAPAAYNNNDEIEIIRKIERDQGSNYKINGKNVRARDVQMLFADTVTGANSPALVSQGRITQIINSKPHDRRMILEESAGISGLYARRHEAELRLKAADTNLVRVEDILGSMEGRLAALKRQARQATRYRNLSVQIRQMELLIAAMEWQALDERMRATKQAFEVAESAVAERLGAVTQLTKTQATQSQDLPELRQKEAHLAATLQVQKVALQRLEDEISRLDQAMNEAREQLAQSETDFTHENQSLNENISILEGLEQEHIKIINEEKSEDGRLEEKDAARDDLEKKVYVLEERFNALMQSAAESKARRESLEQRIVLNQNRLATISERKESAQAKLSDIRSAQNTPVIDFEQEIKTLEQTAEQLSGKIESTQTALQKVAKDIDQERNSLNVLENKQSEFNTEITMLESFLQNPGAENFAPVLTKVSPDQGFEKALSRALGDSLMASLDEKASSSWLESKNPWAALPDLPEGSAPLLPHVRAPKALHVALSQIGVVQSREDGEKLWHALKPGQSLVSAEGTYWRWDGFSIRAEATDRHAQTLEQQNNLKALIKKRPQIEGLVNEARKTLEKVLMQQERLQNEQKAFLEEKRLTDLALSSKNKDWIAARELMARTESEVSRLTDTIKTAQEDSADLEVALENDRTALKDYAQDSESDKDSQLEILKSSLNEARLAHSAAVRAYDLFVQQNNTRKARIRAIADERVNLQNRIIRSKERVKQIDERKVTLSEKLKDLLAQPQDFDDGKAEILEKISSLESERSEAADHLARIENEVLETTKALKTSEAQLGETREMRAHAQATLAAILEQQGAMRLSITEKFEMEPHDLLSHSAMEVSSEPQPVDTLRHKKESLVKERDAIGPVNLQADDEAMSLEKEVTVLLSERNDLVQAIEELRGAIHKINKEARERLLSAFEHVNAHFQRLFERLFVGGKAHLALIDSDDPLGAGLEIYAQPPGKALQSLSLLSGGEQTMASIALIFGMFLTNPSPICVLDEIDAPLDDANVDRVCDLLQEIAARGETRFLVITHHRLSMARMDRLYGVTMAERGISQLVSVDLQHSFSFLEEAA
jgi:chromosome segregation protein